MDLVNGLATTLFDVVLYPFEALSVELAIFVVSAIFGVVALVIFKYISWQKGIKAAKDKIKGHMIAIRIYQDDLPVVGSSVAKVLARNTQYVALNFLPFIPLLAPFAVLMSQLVVRYAFEPLEEGKPFTMIVEMAPESRGDVAQLEVVVPDWVDESEMVLVRAPSEGKAFLSIRDAVPGVWDFGFRVGSGGALVNKPVVIGAETEVPRHFQPERVGTFLEAWLWPAEDTITEAPIDRIAIQGGYPEGSFLWFPDGILGILVGVFVYSMAAGVAVLKPLGVTI